MKNTEDRIVTNKSNKIDELGQYQQYQDLLKAVEDNHRKDTKRMYIFFVIVFFAFIAVVWFSLIFIDSSFIRELRSGNNSLMKNTDYLELVLPILIAIVVAFIAFLGMNRLRDMDAQVNQMRSSINTELEKEIGRVASLRSDLAEHIDVAVNSKTQSFAEAMEKRLETSSQDGVQKVIESKNDALSEIDTSKQDGMQKVIESINDALYKIDTSKQEVEKLATQVKTSFSDFNARYSWLLLCDQVTKDAFLKEVATVFDVHQVVETMWNSADKPNNIAELTRKYVKKVIEGTSDLRGDTADYHNLAAECARHYLYDLSCKVCETGLKFFPEDIDLLSDWIQYGTKIGDIEAVTNKPLRRLLAIDKAYWGWRAFDFTVDFYLAAGMFEEAENLADDFVLYYPYEDRAYYCQAVVCQQRYAKEERIQKTITVLQAAMDKNINCPMCASKLAEVLSDCGRLDVALVAVNYAIQELSQEQPSLNYGYVIYRRALIQDRLAYKAATESLDAHDVAIKAAVDYQVAINSGRLSSITLRQAKVRCNMLKTYFNIKDDELGNTNSNGSDSIELMEALKELSTQSDS